MTKQVRLRNIGSKSLSVVMCALSLVWPGVANVVRADDRIQQVRERYQRLREEYEAAKKVRQQELDAYKMSLKDREEAWEKRKAAIARVELLKRNLEQQTRSLDDNITRVKGEIRQARLNLGTSTIESNRERYRQQIRDAELNLRILERQRARIVAGLAGPLRAAQNVEPATNAYYDARRAALAQYRTYQAAHRQVVELARKLEETRLEWVALYEARRR